MMSEKGTFQRAVISSLALHIAIFGTAFAFASYGGGLLWMNRTIIAVSLVSDVGGSPGGHLRRTMNTVPVRADLSNEEAPVQPVLREEAGQVGDRPDQEQQTPRSANEEGQGVHRGPSEGAAEGTAGGPATERHFGYSSADWQLLQASLERAKIYPRIARERGIEGTVLVRFRARPSGSIEQVDIVKSSGARILDDASVSTVYRAAPVPYVNGWVEVPMVYQIRRAGDQ